MGHVLKKIFHNLEKLSEIEELKEALDKSFNVDKVHELSQKIDTQIEVYNDIKDAVEFINENKEKLIKLTYRFQQRYGRKLMDCVIVFLETFESLEREFKNEKKLLFGGASYENLLLKQKNLLRKYKNYSKYIKTRKKEKQILEGYSSLFSGPTREIIQAEEKTSYVIKLNIGRIASFSRYSFAGIAASILLMMLLPAFARTAHAKERGFFSEFMNSVRHVQVEAGYDGFSPRYKIQAVRENRQYYNVFNFVIESYLETSSWQYANSFHDQNGRNPTIEDVKSANLPSYVKEYYSKVYINNINGLHEAYEISKTKFLNNDISTDYNLITDAIRHDFDSYGSNYLGSITKSTNLSKDQVIGSIADVALAFMEIGENMSDEEVLSKFNVLKNHTNNNEKIFILQLIGDVFSENYDYSRKGGNIKLADLLKTGSHYVKTGDALPLGVCRHINTRIATIARDIFGMQSFVTSFASHVVSGVVDDSGNIVILDYGTAHRTNTPDYREAISYYERATGTIAHSARIFDAEGNLITRVDSEAAKDIEEGLGMYDILEKSFEVVGTKGIQHKPNHLKISLHNDNQNIHLDNNWLVFDFTRFDRSSHAYNAIDKLNVLFLGYQEKSKNGFFKIGGGWIKGRLKGKTLDSPANIYEELAFIASLGDNVYNKQISRNWGINIGLTSQLFITYSLNKDLIGAFKDDLAFSSRLSYFNPQKDYRLFFGCASKINIDFPNVQGVQGGFSNFKNITFHPERLVFEGGLVKSFGNAEFGLKGEVAKTDIGYDIGVSTAYNTPGLSIQAYARRVVSEMVDRGLPTIIPTTTDFGINLDANVLRAKGYTGSIGIYSNYSRRGFKSFGIKDHRANYGLNAIVIF